MAEIIITEKNFDSEVLKSEKPVLLDFWATWCGPCMMVSPILSEIAAERDDITVGKVNVDEQPGLADSYEIESIPTIMLVKNGRVVSSSVGYQSKEKLLEILK